MKTCYVMVGLPASGKSTFIKEMCIMDPDAYVYSTDNILERIASQLGKTYNDVFSNHISSAQREADIWLDDAIKNDLNVIWDQTNLGVKKRRGIIQRMKKAGYNIEAIAFRAPDCEDDIVEWNRRLHSRKGKTIPENIIQNMVKTYVEPTLDEGFDRVTIMDIYGEVVQ